MFWFLVALILFVGSFALFGFAFDSGEFFAFLGWAGFPFEVTVFTAGILAVSLSIIIPMHLLGSND